MKKLLIILLFLSAHFQLSAQDLSGTWYGKINGDTGIQIKIQQSGDKLSLDLQGNVYVGRLLQNKFQIYFSYKSLEEVPPNFSEIVREKILQDSSLIEGEVLSESALKISIFLQEYDEKTGERLEVTELMLELWRPQITIFNQYNEEISVTAEFSHPRPVVTIKRAEFLSSFGEEVTVHISGSVRCAIADIVADGKADISKVFAEFLDVNSEFEDSLRSVPIPVTRKDTATNPNQPYLFLGTFDSILNLPVFKGEVLISIRADNIIGNSGYDSFSIISDPGLSIYEVDDTVRVLTSPIQKAEIQHHRSTNEGLVNPLRIIVNDTLPAYEFGEQVINFNGHDFHFVLNESGQLQMDQPIMALAGTVPEEIPNLISIEKQDESSIKYKKQEIKISWNYTTHSPANYFTYASGTKVTHEIEDVAFSQWKIQKVKVQRKVAGSWNDDPGIQATPKSIRLIAGRKPTLVLSLTLAKKSHLIPEKRILVTMTRGNRTVIHPMGSFKVDKLKTVNITVDGFAYESAIAILNNPGQNAPTFKKIFGSALNKDEAALSAIPTVTWVNWSGIFSNQSPSLHGVTGNSFFERERAGSLPFASASDKKLDKVHGVQATLGGLNNRAKTSSGSFYDDLNIKRAISVHQWYYKSTNATVRVRHFPYSKLRHAWLFTLHESKAANELDKISSEIATQEFNARPCYDVFTVYFPGPDNIAHAIGDKTGKDRHKDAIPGGAFSPGPKLPIVNTPLLAIQEQVTERTDRYLFKLVDAIEKGGYQYCTIFTLVADHGLHAYHNTKDYNITLGGGLHDLLKSRQWVVWRGVTNKFRTTPNPFNPGSLKPVVFIGAATIVYSPNGGMAQFYVRADQKTWSSPATKDQIEQLARTLYIESVGGSAIHPMTGINANYGNAYMGTYRTLGPKKNPAFGNKMDHGAFGSPPAIFLKVNDTTGGNNFLADYRWVKFAPANTYKGLIEYGTIDDFIAVRKTNGLYPGFDWPEFKERIHEFNDKNPNGSRSGDVIVFADGRAGYMCINDGDELNGWHGGATISESYVPLMFNIPGNVVDKKFISTAISAVKKSKSGKRFRNWDLGNILKEIYTNLYP